MVSTVGARVSFSSARILATALVVALTASWIVGVSPLASAAATVPYFGPNVMAYAPPAYTAYEPSLAVGASGTLYLAYAGWGGSGTQVDVFFTKSSDGGMTWAAPVLVNNDGSGATQREPSLSLDASDNIYIAWRDTRTGTDDIYFSKSTDGGLSFSANVRVNDMTTSWQIEPALAVDAAGLVHVVWTDNRNRFSTGPDIYYANSTDGGLSFNPNTRVNNDATGAEQGSPALAVAPDGSLYAVWADPRVWAQGLDIYFSKSSDSGDTWNPNIIVNDNGLGNVRQDDPAIAVDTAGSIYVTWADWRDTNTAPDIYSARSTNGGASFAADVQVNDESGAIWQSQPSIAANASRVQIAWTDARTFGSSAYDIYTASSADGITWEANVRVNDDTYPTNWQQTPTIAVDADGNVYAAWLDQRTSGQDVYASTLDVVPPSAIAGPDRSVNQGVFVQLNGSASTDNVAIASYSWNFGDGTTSSGAVVSHAFAEPGTYDAVLTVWDYSGNSASDSVRVTVRDTVAPTARSGGDRVVDEGQPLLFDASASTDNVGITSYAWDFGDGGTSSEAAVTHVYSTPGTYDVSLTVTDGAGNADMVTITVTVRPVTPKAGELLGMIQLLTAVVVVLGLVLALVGYLAFVMWPPPPAPSTAPPPAPPMDPDPIDMTPPSSDLPKRP